MAKVYIEYNVPPSLRVVGRAFLRWWEELRRVGASFFGVKASYFPRAKKHTRRGPARRLRSPLLPVL